MNLLHQQQAPVNGGSAGRRRMRYDPRSHRAQRAAVRGERDVLGVVRH